MDIKTYISSGKLELFVLGELNETEQQEVMAMAKKYPEVQKELESIEEAMFAFDQISGKKPSPGLKNKIFESLDQEEMEADGISSKTLEKAPEEKSVVKEVKIDLWKQYAVAASLVAVLAVGAAIYFATRYYDVEERFTLALQQNAVLAEEVQSNQVKFDQLDTSMEQLLAGDFQRVPMRGEGLPMQEDALVDVYWDQNSKEVLLSVNQLADLDENNDYQLWAIGEEGPIGIGLVNPGERLSLQQMALAQGAQAFAITIEPKGGSESPTLEKLVVLGEVS